MSRASLDFLWGLEEGAGVGESVVGLFIARFSGLPLLMRVFRLRPSLSVDPELLNLVFLLVVPAHDPSIESTSSDGITNSGSGDLLFPLVFLRGGVNLRGT